MLTDHDELGAWLRLLQTPGIGPETARKLMAALGPPQAIWQCSHSDWARVVSTRIALAMAQEPDELQPLLRNTVAWL
ncbi:MAG: DNA-protecting protein DprA, partial [Pseudomonadota bacterium]